MFCVFLSQPSSVLPFSSRLAYSAQAFPTPGGPEKFRWTKSRHICICTYHSVQSTHVYIYAGQWDEILNQLLFDNIFFLPKKQSKRCEGNTKNSNDGSELPIPSIKGTKVLFKVIQAIIIIWVGSAL